MVTFQNITTGEYVNRDYVVRRIGLYSVIETKTGEKLFEDLTDLLDFNFFPDGQVQVVIDAPKLNAHYSENRDRCQSYHTLVKCSVTDSIILDVVYQLALTKEFGKFEILYWYGSRSDKKYTSSGKLVSRTADLLSSYAVPSKWLAELRYPATLLPHHLPETESRNFDVVNLFTQLFRAMPNRTGTPQKYDFVLFPDESAETKFKAYTDKLQLPSLKCYKVRDDSGEITSHKIPKFPAGSSILVVDDLCDGGATFENLSKSLAGQGISYIDLMVHHGVFSNRGFYKLQDYFDEIVFTNSYPGNYPVDLPTVVDVWSRPLESAEGIYTFIPKKSQTT